VRRLLLDFGGVVIRTPFEMLHRVGHPEWAGPFDPDSDPLWRAMQIGEMTERDYWDRRATEVFPGVDDPVASLMDTLFAPPRDDVIRPETMMLIEEVPRPAVLTNDLARFHSPAWLDEMGLGTSFDPLIDLSYTGRLKPHPLAYAHAVERLDADPGQVVFADDQPANVAAGIAFGLHAVWFDVTDPRGSVERIRLALG
jgi:putative hydrolase of the HAD superfamily